MSFWTYIHGSIQVSVPGRTQPEIQYILSSVLDHLPRVTGSEGDMEIHCCQRKGYTMSSSCDEYGMSTNNLINWYGDKTRKGSLHTQDEYTISVHAGLRDRFFAQTKTEFMKWLIRLAKRLWVQDILVRITGDTGESLLLNMPNGMYEIHEHPSWGWRRHRYDPEEVWWGEHLMWDRAPTYDSPIQHIVKYTDDEEMKKEFVRRRKWEEAMEDESGRRDSDNSLPKKET